MSEMFSSCRKYYWRALEWKRTLSKKALRHKSESAARRSQTRALNMLRPDHAPARLVIFLAPGSDKVNGGIMSIVSIFEETRRMQDQLGALVVLCTLPQDPPLLSYSKFPNDAVLFNFRDVLERFSEVQEILIHVPEYAVEAYLDTLGPRRKSMFKSIRVTHNVLLQNIDYADFKSFAALRELGAVTCTTAHKAYCNAEIQSRAGCSLHLLSVFISPERYSRSAFSEKDNLLVVSPDRHEAKEAILNGLRQTMPKLQVQVIRDLTYEEYKAVIARAKWCLTFGEGLDGYFIETVFSGGISFAVYNERFFTPDFLAVETVYQSYEGLASRMARDIERLDNASAYEACQAGLYKACTAHYDYRRYRANVADYYERYWARDKPGQPLMAISP